MRVAIVGAGGQAREIAWLLREINLHAPSYELVGFVVSDLGRLTDYDSRDRLLGDYEWLERNPLDGIISGIGSPEARLRVASELQQAFPRLEWPTVVHPSAALDRESTKLGRGVIVCTGTVITVNVVLDDFALINPSCTVGHEAVVGRGSVTNHASSISGGVVLGEAVLIGTGARVLQYLRVGSGARVGAGAVVTRDVPPGETVVGIPARPLPSSDR